MLKTLLLVLAGLGAGLVLAFWLQPSSSPPLAELETTDGLSPLMRSRAAADDASAARLAALEDAFAAEVEQRAALEARVAELAAELEALGERAPQAAGAPTSTTAPPTRRPPSSRCERVLAPTAAPRVKRSSAARSSS